MQHEREREREPTKKSARNPLTDTTTFRMPDFVGATPWEAVCAIEAAQQVRNQAVGAIAKIDGDPIPRGTNDDYIVVASQSVPPGSTVSSEMHPEFICEQTMDKRDYCTFPSGSNSYEGMLLSVALPMMVAQLLARKVIVPLKVIDGASRGTPIQSGPPTGPFTNGSQVAYVLQSSPPAPADPSRFFFPHVDGMGLPQAAAALQELATASYNVVFVTAEDTDGNPIEQFFDTYTVKSASFPPGTQVGGSGPFTVQLTCDPPGDPNDQVMLTNVADFPVRDAIAIFHGQLKETSKKGELLIKAPGETSVQEAPQGQVPTSASVQPVVVLNPADVEPRG